MINFKIHRTIFLGFCFFACFQAWAAEVVPLDKVVAVVNNSVLTQNQLNETIIELKQQLQATGQAIPEGAALRKKALDRAIGELLQLQIAQRANIKLSDADVTRAINQIAAQNKLSLDQLTAELEKQGIDYTQYRKQIHDQIILQQVQQQALAGKVNVSKAEVQAYLKKAPAANNDQAQYRLDDLLIPLKEEATPQQVEAATQQAKELLNKASAGASFSELAKGPVQRIGLEWRMAKDLPEVFANALRNLKVGEIAGPIKAPNGLHLLHLLEARGNAAALNEAQAKQIVFQKKLQEQVDKWTQELRKSAYVKIM
jgi:peptidyl-prolyl cis-trans isomerase SurA